MKLSEIRLASLKAYCRLDVLEEGERELLETMYLSAVNYMTEAGVSEPEAGTERRAQYDLCVNHLVLTAYDSRGALLTSGGQEDNPAFRRLLNQLKRSEPVPDSGTGSGMGG